MTELFEQSQFIPVTPSATIEATAGPAAPVGIGNISQGWTIDSEGNAAFNNVAMNEHQYFDETGALISTLRGISINDPTFGVSGFLINTTPGYSTNYQYMFTSAGFIMPGGTFIGDITLDTEASDAQIAFTIELDTNNFLVMGGARSPMDNTGAQLTLDGQDITTSSDTVSHKIPILINGVQYYILLTNSGASYSDSPSPAP